VGRLPEEEDQEQENAVHPEARIHGGVPDEHGRARGRRRGSSVRRATLPYQGVQDRVPAAAAARRRHVVTLRKRDERSSERDRGSRRAATFPRPRARRAAIRRVRRGIFSSIPASRTVFSAATAAAPRMQASVSSAFPAPVRPLGEDHPGEAGEGHRRDDARLGQEDADGFPGESAPGQG